MYLKIMSLAQDGEFSILHVGDDVHLGEPPENVKPVVVHQYDSESEPHQRKVYFFDDQTLQPHLVVFPANTAFLMGNDGKTIERL